MIFTSNRALEKWAEVFNNRLPASATLDCLIHHTHTLILRSDSYRQPISKNEPILIITP